MPAFRAIYSDNAPRAFTFEAKNVSEALTFLQQHDLFKPVELWCDGGYLGRLEHIIEDDASFWRIG